MNRNMVYPGAIPLDTDLLNVQRSTMIALGYLIQAAFGSGTYFDGLPCTQEVVPNMSVNIGPGSVMALSTIDNTAFGSLSADASDPLVKMGINIGNTTLTLTAPATSGFSMNFLVEGAFQETDQTAVILPYYNSTMPSVPFSGPSNSGAAQNTQRLQLVNIQLKAGTPAATGSQVTPGADSGFFPLYVIVVPFGTTSILNSNISVAPGAPFIPNKLTTSNATFVAKHNVLGSRTLATTYGGGPTYTNSTGKPMFVSAQILTAANDTNTVFTVDGVDEFIFGEHLTGTKVSVSGMVPAGSTYAVSNTLGGTVQNWVETY